MEVLLDRAVSIFRLQMTSSYKNMIVPDNYQ